MNTQKQRIGIIGAGASGLTTAWLLDKDHQVTLFEKESYAGGHVCTMPITIDGKTVPVEAGVEFFSDMMFGDFNRLLSLLQVPVTKYPLSYSFYHIKTDQVVSLPPLHDGHLSWHSLSANSIIDLLEFNHFINGALQIIATKDMVITLQDYADSLTLTTAFKNEFLYPFLAAAWGVTPQKMMLFSAYDIVRWAKDNSPTGITPINWNEIVGGMHVYIEKLIAQLSNTAIHYSCSIDKITFENDTYTIKANGKQTTVDHLIIATNAHEAHRLLIDITHAAPLASILASIKYFYTTIAIHGDRRLMPADEADWAIANIRYDGVNSALTVCKSWMREIPIFRSWITYTIGMPENDPLPQPLYAMKHFYHPTVDAAYFNAQTTIAELQGNNNLWIAGFYTHDVDSHNSAIVSAINIAKKLAPNSERLIALTS